MRAIRRPIVEFPELESKTNVLEDELRQAPGSFDPKFDTKAWRTPDLLGVLLAMHGRVCAYCQGQLTPSDRGDVEHFRPKSIYWWLAYRFDNYLLSCARCNRSRKGKKFPLAAGESGLEYGDGRDEESEKRLLLDPTRDEVDQLFKLKRERKTWFLRPVIRAGQVDPQADATIRFFELNLGDLPGTRQIRIKEALREAKKVRGGADVSTLKRMASRFEPYGFVVRKVLNRNYPDLLPTVREEVRFLIEDLKTMLESYESGLHVEDPGHDDTENRREVTLWALATIWREPPDDVTPSDVSKMIGNRWRPHVKEILDSVV